MNPILLQLALTETPAIIAAVREAFGHKDPTAPVPTDEEILTAFEAAFQSSRAKDAQWLAAHPEQA